MDRFQILSALERRITYARGKGFGARSVHQEVRLLLSALGERPRLAIDVGGNVGDYSAALRASEKELEIHVFEPSPINVAKLQTRFRADPLIRIIPSAIAESSGTATLYSNEPGSVLGSLVKRDLDHFSIEFNREESVATLRFEDYWRAELNGRRVDLVKLDVEGYEFEALKGFGEAIGSIGVIQFEFGGCNIDTRVFFRDFWQFFQMKGFEIFRIGPWGLEHIPKYRESDECFLTTNFIARNTN